jgi:enamine deaminase RidA (YjgF/YER057c/UK114 family)
MPTASVWWRAALCLSLSGWDANQHFQSEELVPQFEQALKNILAVLAQAGGIFSTPRQRGIKAPEQGSSRAFGE